jgi:predicted secreted Zn-dependent protease
MRSYGPRMLLACLRLALQQNISISVIQKFERRSVHFDRNESSDSESENEREGVVDNISMREVA